MDQNKKNRINKINKVWFIVIRLYKTIIHSKNNDYVIKAFLLTRNFLNLQSHYIGITSNQEFSSSLMWASATKRFERSRIFRYVLSYDILSKRQRKRKGGAYSAPPPPPML